MTLYNAKELGMPLNKRIKLYEKEGILDLSDVKLKNGRYKIILEFDEDSYVGKGNTLNSAVLAAEKLWKKKYEKRETWSRILLSML